MTKMILPIIALVLSMSAFAYMILGVSYPKQKTLTEFADSIYTAGYKAGTVDMQLSMLGEIYNNRDTIKRVIYMKDIDYKRIDRSVDSMKRVRDSIHKSKY